MQEAVRRYPTDVDILIDSVTYTYPSGVTAVRGVSLMIGAGESLALIGQNGSGKTTLAKHFNGLLKPTTGSIRVGDWDSRQRSVAQLANLVGFVFQNPDDQLFASKVLTEVMFGPKNQGLPEEAAAARAQLALEMVELRETGEWHPYELSIGQRKRLAIASVLAMDTPVVVMDEPTTGQDYNGVELVGRIVDELISQGKTVIAITHDMDFCAEHFGRVVVMMGGQVLLDGPAREVLPQEEVLARTFVEPPQLMRLAARLGMEKMPLSVDEFVSLLLEAKF